VESWSADPDLNDKPEIGESQTSRLNYRCARASFTASAIIKRTDLQGLYLPLQRVKGQMRLKTAGRDKAERAMILFIHQQLA
jgi:hypothetical protein